MAGLQPQRLIQRITQRRPPEHHAGQLGTGFHLFAEERRLETQALSGIEILSLSDQRRHHRLGRRQLPHQGHDLQPPPWPVRLLPDPHKLLFPLRFSSTSYQKDPQ